MLSNLNSCHGVFIPTSLQKPPSPLFTPSSAAPPYSGTNTRHYRYSSSASASASVTYSPTPSKANETKRNKQRTFNNESIWAKIEQDFTPELLEEYNHKPDHDITDIHYTIPEVSHSSKQGGGGGGGGGG